MRALIAALAAAAVGGVVYLVSRETSPTSGRYTPRMNPHAWRDEIDRRHFWRDNFAIESTSGWRKPPPPAPRNLDAAMNDAADALNMTPPDNKPPAPPRYPDDGSRAGNTPRAKPIVGDTSEWDKPPPPTAANLQRAESDAAADLDMTPGGIKVRNGERYPKQYDPLIQQAAAQNHLTPEVLKAVLMTESSLQPRAVGPQTPYGTAKGIAQFLDTTWGEWGRGGDVFNPKDAIPAAARYIRWLLDRPGVDGDYRSALIAYNQGIGNFWRGKRYPAAVNYADKILRIAQ